MYRKCPVCGATIDMDTLVDNPYCTACRIRLPDDFVVRNTDSKQEAGFEDDEHEEGDERGVKKEVGFDDSIGDEGYGRGMKKEVGFDDSIGGEGDERGMKKEAGFEDDVGNEGYRQDVREEMGFEDDVIEEGDERHTTYHQVNSQPSHDSQHLPYAKPVHQQAARSQHSYDNQPPAYYQPQEQYPTTNQPPTFQQSQKQDHTTNQPPAYQQPQEQYPPSYPPPTYQQPQEANFPPRLQQTQQQQYSNQPFQSPGHQQQFSNPHQSNQQQERHAPPGYKQVQMNQQPPQPSYPHNQPYQQQWGQPPQGYQHNQPYQQQWGQPPQGYQQNQPYQQQWSQPPQGYQQNQPYQQQEEYTPSSYQQNQSYQQQGGYAPSGYPQNTQQPGYNYPYQPPIAQRYGVQYPQQYGYWTPMPVTSNKQMHKLSAISLFLFYALFTINVIGLIYALFVVPPEIMNDNVHPFFFVVPYPPFVVGLDISVTGPLAAVYFLLIAAAIFLSLGYQLYKDGYSFFRTGRKYILDEEIVGQEEQKEYDNNAFVLVGELFMAVLFFNIIFFIFLAIIGQSMSTPESLEDSATWELMVGLAVASVWEEVVSRILFIGVPLCIINAFSVKKSWEQRTEENVPSDGSDMEKPKQLQWYNYLLGGNIEITPLVTILILFSSILFGLAHSSSWDYWKVVPTTVAGLAFGYLFVKKGVHAAILLHFAFDYLAILPEAIGGAGGLIIAAITGLILLVIILVGGFFFYKYSKWTLAYLQSLLAPGSSKGGVNDG